jgi:hypothetical protein
MNPNHHREAMGRLRDVGDVDIQKQTVLVSEGAAKTARLWT